MAERHLSLPAAADAIGALRVGDTVHLSGEVTVTGGLPAHQRLAAHLAAGTPLPLPVTDTFLHLPHLVEEKPGGGHRIHYVNPTTSTRFDAFMPGFIRGFGLRIVGGKGGLGAASVAAMHERGCVYLSLLGGGSALLTDAIKQVVAVAWHDLPPHFRLTRLRVEGLGPLTVGIDAHGGSIYADLAAGARAALPGILARLDQRRAASF